MAEAYRTELIRAAEARPDGTSTAAISIQSAPVRAALTTTRGLWLIVILALALRIFPIWFGLPYPHARPDEAVAVGHAMDVLEGEFNPRFFHWPSLIFYLFAAVFAVAAAARQLFQAAGDLDPVTALVAARGAVAIAGAATAVVVYRIGRRVAGGPAGLVAALFLAVALLHVRDSHFAMTDVVMTLLVTVSLALLLRALDRARDPAQSEPSRLGDFALAGLAGGLAASTKYNAAAIVAAMAAAQLVLWTTTGTRPWRPRSWLPAIGFGLAFVLGFVGGTPYSVLDYRTFAADVLFDVTHLSTGHGVSVGRGWIYHATRSLPYGAGIITFAAAVAALPFALRRHPGPMLVLAAFAGALYAAIGSGYTVFFRYVLPLVPILCVVAAIGVCAAGAALAARFGRAGATGVAILAAIVALPSLVNSVWFDIVLARTDTRVLAGQWLAPRLRAGESVHDAGGDYARLQLGATRYHEWHFDPASDSFGHPEGLTPDWLVLTQSPLRTYAHADPQLRRLASERYDLVHTVRGTRGAAGAAVYDLQDAFFLPLSGFHTVLRPGPTIHIYRKRGQPPFPDGDR